jgi:hypothetical protein
MKKFFLLVALLCLNVGIAQDFSGTVSSYMDINRSALGLQDQDIDEMNIDSHSYSKSMDVHNVWVTQQFNSIDLFNSTSSFAIRGGAVMNANLSFFSNISERINTSNPSITPSAAIINAATALGIQNPSELILLETISDHTFIYSDGNISMENIPVKLVFQHTSEGTLRLAWDLSIYLMDASHYYSVRIDAVTGQLLDTIDWVVSCEFGNDSDFIKIKNGSQDSLLFPQTEDAAMVLSSGGAQYRVFAMPLRNPNDGPDTLENSPEDPTASPFGWHDTDGVGGPEFTITRGNNVWAQEDQNGNNGTGYSPDGGGTLNFDFPYDLPQPPANFLDASITNLFYWNNIIHDVTYHYGFDETSGNFQENNYDNGGLGSDSVNADAQDGSGQNNANFATPPDGSNPRMQMFLWDPAGLVELLNINNGPLAGPYLAVAANYGGAMPASPLTEDLVVVEDDNSGTSDDPNDACDPITNGGSLDGKIAVIRRGECEFGFKSLAAQNEGAIAVIMVNNVPGDPITMGGGVYGGSVTIPCLMVSQTDGEAIIAEILGGNTVNGTIQEVPLGPEICGDLDNEVITHEYGHGVSNRLTGGPNNVGCLGNAEQMGEGWSDYLGLILTMKSTDEGTDIRGIGTYDLGQGLQGSGFREAPYSTDFAINDYTYADTNNNVSQPHGIGFVWATMLWDMTWLFIDEYGFDPDFYNGTGGNNIAFQLVMDGMKLQNCNPGFVDGRDAILEADELANGGANYCLIWTAFANRGLGVSASQGSPFSRTDQVEAFDLPNECDLGYGDNELENRIVIYPNPSNGQINIKAFKDLGEDVQITIYDINGRIVHSQNVALHDRAQVNADSLRSGIYIIEINAEKYTHTSKLVIR